MSASARASAPGNPLPREVKAWGAVSLLSDLSHEAVTSILPLFLVSIGGSPAALGAIEGVSDALSTFAKLAGGWAADKVRRRKPLAVAGYVVTAVSVPAIALARTPAIVVVLRGFGWIGRGFRSPLRDTLLVAAVSERTRGRAFGLERALDQVGAVLAPLAVLLLVGLSFDVRTIMGLAVVPGVAALACVLLFVREHEHVEPAAPGIPEPERAVPTVPFRRFLFAVAVFGCGDFAKTLLVLWAVGPEGGSMTPTVIGTGVLLYAWFNAVTVGSAYLAGRLSDHVGRGPVLTVAYVTGAAGAAVPILFAAGPVAGAVALALSGLLVGAEESVERAWAADLAGGRRHGRAFGLLHGVNGAADLVASGGVGLLWVRFGPEVAFGAAAGMMAVGAWMTSRIRAGSDKAV